MTLPTDLYKLDIVKVGSGKLATEVNKKEEHYITSLGSDSLLYPTKFRPIFTRASSTTIRITPSPNDGSSCTVSYYKKPTAPNWTYIIVGGTGKALYNSGAADAQNFELVESEEEPLVSKILMLSGVVTKQQDIGQVGVNAIQMTNQEQNS